MLPPLTGHRLAVMTTAPAPDILVRLRLEIEHRLPWFLADLEAIVGIESGSYTKDGTDALLDWLAERLQRLGGVIERDRQAEPGDTISAHFGPSRPGPSVLLLGHADTVFEPGTLLRRPFERRTDRLMGPGVSDMKAGLLVGIYAIEALQAVGGEAWPLPGGLRYLINADEEIGSPLSTPVIESAARSADVAFVLEAARANGDIVSARKGMVHLRATVRGRAAHAGVEPEKGRSAVLEAAHKTISLHGLSGRWPGVTVNVGELAGGTRPNIVADECRLTIDLRAAEARSQDEAEAAIRAILDDSTIDGVTTTVERLAATRPMEKTAASSALAASAASIAAVLGFELRDAHTGGSSDANTTAALGVATLDGLGPIGGLDHTPDEYVELGSIVPRTTLLAGLLLAVGEVGAAREVEGS
jgi:glutamate carboxypeptidase